VLLVTRAGVGRAAAMSVLAMDQLLVGAAKLLVLAAAALVAPLPPWMTRSILGLLAGLLALGAALVIASWRHADVEAVRRPLARARVVAALAAFSRALAPLRAPDRIAPAFALALLKKLAEVCAIVCVQRAFGVHLPFANGIVVLAVLNLATLLPVVPGNVGVYEAAVMLALTRQGIPGEQALGIAVVQHLCYFLALAGPGLLWAGRQR